MVHFHVEKANGGYIIHEGGEDRVYFPGGFINVKNVMKICEKPNRGESLAGESNRGESKADEHILGRAAARTTNASLTKRVRSDAAAATATFQETCRDRDDTMAGRDYHARAVPCAHGRGRRYKSSITETTGPARACR